MSEFIVEAKELSRTFRSGRRRVDALRQVSLGIRRGSITGLVGESGSGKTTLARCLLLLERPSSGSVTYDGLSLQTLSRRELRSLRTNMQIVFQDPNNALNPRISVYRSLTEGLANRRISGVAREHRIEELADLVSIPYSHLKRRPRDFSGGQRQRLVIARALSMEPDFLVLDEPVSNLDVSIQAQIINLLMELKEKLDLTYLFISHDLNLVSYISDVVGVMYSGQLVEVGPVESIMKTPLHGYTQSLLSSSARLMSDRIVGRVSPAGPTPLGGSGCAYREQCEFSTGRCAADLPVLVDAGAGHMVACKHAADLSNNDINDIEAD